MATNANSGLGNAQRLRQSYAAIRIAFSFFAMTKKVDAYVTQDFCAMKSADPALVKISKKLMSDKIPEYRALTALRSEIKRTVESMTLPYPEDKVRLVPNSKLEALNARLDELKAQWDAAVPAFDRAYQRKLESEEFRNDLGELYNRADYPDSIADRFGFSKDFPSVEPPQYLMQLNPRLYEEQAAFVKAQFEQAANLAITELMARFREMVAHLAEALAGSEDGKPKRFHDSTVKKISEFIENFRTLNINADEGFEALMQQCGTVIRGVTPDDLRSFDTLRTQTRDAMTNIQTQLDQMMEVRGRRAIIREPEAAPQTSAA